MKERDYYFDNAKCALMLLVVFGHFLRPYIDGVLWVHSLYTWIFFFHMPAFIFISGYFAKKFHEHGYLQKITKKWLIPYVLFQLLYSIYYFFLYDKQSLELDLLTRIGVYGFCSACLAGTCCCYGSAGCQSGSHCRWRFFSA
ncbi:Acyltransferase family protein [Geobacillus sp. BCO2]|nr:Acyltransferase family protein [Geobacillus sp. BCO2]